MNPGPHHFLSMLLLLLPAFLLPARVELCLASWIECEACPGCADGGSCGESAWDEARHNGCHSDPSTESAPSAEPSLAPEGVEKDSAEHANSGCCCCSHDDPGPTAEPTEAGDPAPLPRPSLSSPDASCACCVHLDKPHEEPRDETARAALDPGHAAARVVIAQLPTPSLASARALPRRNPTPPPLRPLPLRL